MTLSPADRLAVMELRMDSARKALDDARLLHHAESIRGSVNRVYYAMFYAASALAVANGQSFTKHSALISYIHREFVKSGRLEREHGRALQEAFEDRSEGDYQDVMRIKSDDVETMIRQAVEFIAAVARLIADQR